MSQTTPYDEVPYPGYTHPQTHPDRLATIGTVFGMRPAAIDHCRVLELGCGDGSNLVPMAFSLTGSEFVGMDLAATAVAKGQRAVAELGLKNIALRREDILAFPKGLGKFDYIIAHGIYSWAPGNVRDALLRICREHLQPHGVAFVSYNAYPGGHLRNMVRDMMFFHLRGVEGSQERLSQAMALVQFMSRAKENHDVYARFLQEEFDQMVERSAGHLYHDELSEIYEPVYFHQFAGHGHQYGLQYVGEADFMEMQDHLFTEATRKVLNGLSENRIAWEQYLDFLKCRRFRQTLLCHAEVSLQVKPGAEVIRSFHLASMAKAASPNANLSDRSVVKFSGKKTASVETNLPSAKAALARLGSIWPQALRLEELGEANDPALCEVLFQTYRTGLLELHTHHPTYSTTPSERPVASPLARWQLQNGLNATSAWHQSVEVGDAIGKFLIGLLDGSRDRAMLVDELRRFGGTLTGNVEEQLERNLRMIARFGLLVA